MKFKFTNKGLLATVIIITFISSILIAGHVSACFDILHCPVSGDESLYIVPENDDIDDYYLEGDHSIYNKPGPLDKPMKFIDEGGRDYE